MNIKNIIQKNKKEFLFSYNNSDTKTNMEGISLWKIIKNNVLTPFHSKITIQKSEMQNSNNLSRNMLTSIGKIEDLNDSDLTTPNYSYKLKNNICPQKNNDRMKSKSNFNILEINEEISIQKLRTKKARKINLDKLSLSAEGKSPMKLLDEIQINNDLYFEYQKSKHEIKEVRKSLKNSESINKLGFNRNLVLMRQKINALSMMRGKLKSQKNNPQNLYELPMMFTMRRRSCDCKFCGKETKLQNKLKHMIFKLEAEIIANNFLKVQVNFISDRRNSTPIRKSLLKENENQRGRSKRMGSMRKLDLVSNEEIRKSKMESNEELIGKEINSKSSIDKNLYGRPKTSINFKITSTLSPPKNPLTSRKHNRLPSIDPKPPIFSHRESPSKNTNIPSSIKSDRFRTILFHEGMEKWNKEKKSASKEAIDIVKQWNKRAEILFENSKSIKINSSRSLKNYHDNTSLKLSEVYSMERSNKKKKMKKPTKQKISKRMGF